MLEFDLELMYPKDVNGVAPPIPEDGYISDDYVVNGYVNESEGV